jgi:transcriptional regulator with XRE-family HTH domain
MRRFEKEMSQEELAEQADIHPTYLSSIERGYCNPSFEKIILIARALKCSPKDLMPEK